MTISETLTIKLNSRENEKYVFECIGSIDAHAEKSLQVLKDLPPGVHVTLNFNKIERVNSMGLSLLLKIFEDWEQANTRIEVRNLNRMVSMLFKITGLGRFIEGNDTLPSDPSNRKVIEPTGPLHNSPPVQTSSGISKDSKLNFVASLQSGHQLSGWYLFNTYLQRKMQRAIHFEQLQDVSKKTDLHLFFAKPFDACAKMKEKDFLPLVRPISDPDEVVVLVREDDSRTLLDFKDKKVNVVTADQGSFVYLLGRFLCDESGLDSSSFNFVFSGNEIKSLQMLIRKKTDMAFILKKTYQGLSSFSRKSVRLLDESETDFAYHLFCITPQLKDESDKLKQVLMQMNQDEQGERILNDIQFQGWCEPEEGELSMLRMVFDRYTHCT